MFSSTDGIPLKGWWIPGRSKAVIFAIHGYDANRVGWRGKDKSGKDDVLNWLTSAVPLNKAGYNLLYFDLRACGEPFNESSIFFLTILQRTGIRNSIPRALKGELIIRKLKRE